MKHLRRLCSVTVHDGEYASAPADITVTVLPPAPEQIVPPSEGVRTDPISGAGTGQAGDRVTAQTSTDMETWENLTQSIAGETLRIPVTHQPDQEDTRRFYRLTTGPFVNAGSALRFDDTDGTVTVPHDPVFNSYPMTASAYVLTTTTDNEARGIMEKYIGGGFNGWIMFLHQGRVRAWYFRDASNYVWNPAGDGLGIDGGPVADGFWHHCALTVDADGGKLYVDGTLTGSLPWTGTPGAATTTLPLRFGIYTAMPLTGDLDDLNYFSRALSAAEVFEIVRISPNAGAPDIESLWRFDEGTGLSAGSSSSAARSGTLSGGVQWTPSSAPIYRQ